MLPDSRGADHFRTALLALGDALDEIVVVGGWAHRLFALHPLARRVVNPPIATLDADIVVSTACETDLDGRLQRGGFRVERRGNATPQLARYRPGVADHEGDEFYLEFLVPRTGASRGRSGRLKNTLTVAGVVAQQLPHIELLTEDTWTVSVDGLQQAVRIPNAARYLAQKLLVLDQRAVTGKRPNDVRYCYDTLHCFGDALVELSALAASIRWSAAWKKRLRRGRLLLEDADLLARAARLPDGLGRSVSRAALAATLADGLDIIFGPLDS